MLTFWYQRCYQDITAVGEGKPVLGALGAIAAALPDLAPLGGVSAESREAGDEA
jgi:hypothetical protein